MRDIVPSPAPERPSHTKSHETPPQVRSNIGVSVSARGVMTVPPARTGTQGQHESVLLSRQPWGLQG